MEDAELLSPASCLAAGPVDADQSADKAQNIYRAASSRCNTRGCLDADGKRGHQARADSVLWEVRGIFEKPLKQFGHDFSAVQARIEQVGASSSKDFSVQRKSNRAGEESDKDTGK